MAAEVTPLLLLLLLHVSNIRAEVIKKVGDSYIVIRQRGSDFCSVSRWTGEGKELMWNMSVYYYAEFPLNVSHSGQHQEQCWTRGKVTLERNFTLLVCDDQKMRDHKPLHLNAGQTVELTCDNVGPSQSVQWVYMEYRKFQGLIFIVNEVPPGNKLQLVKNKPSVLLTVGKRSFSFYCLERKQQHRCDLHSRFRLTMPQEYVLRSVGESLELNCSDGGQNQTHKWKILNSMRSERESLNSTLMLPSLTLDHTGAYICELSASGPEDYVLYVCPESEPPTVELFTGGENLTLHCSYWNETGCALWLMRSNRTEGRVSLVYENQWPDNMYLFGMSLMIRNISWQDSGQYWCVVQKDLHCVFRCEFQVMLREPGVDHHLIRSVLLSVVMVMMLCVVVVTVWRSRTREVLPPPVEELEMSQLSPESDLQHETPD